MSNPEKNIPLTKKNTLTNFQLEINRFNSFPRYILKYCFLENYVWYQKNILKGVKYFFCQNTPWILVFKSNFGRVFLVLWPQFSSDFADFFHDLPPEPPHSSSSSLDGIFTLIFIFGIHKWPNWPKNWHFFTQKWSFRPKNDHRLFFYWKPPLK